MGESNGDGGGRCGAVAPSDVSRIQVGRTALLRGRNVERALGFERIYFKFEGGNPTGCQKDRAAFELTRKAAREGYQVITLATCGNFGVAAAYAASHSSLRTLIFLPERYHARRLTEMTHLGAEVIRVDGDYEAAVAQSREAAERDGLFDANPGGKHGVANLEAYGEIAREIVEVLGDAPYAVAVPVSNGTTLAGIFDGFRRLHESGKASRIPRMVAASSYRKNPIVRSFREGFAFCMDLQPSDIHETTVNEPLINWHSFDGELALRALRATRGYAEYASDQDMLQSARLLLQREGLSVLPASASALIALAKVRSNGGLPEDDHVVILTGRRQ
jgi:threonine synthase